jgi:membrane glycosyltransferase
MRMAALSDIDASDRPAPELAEIILDPYANALHVSLLRENALNVDYAKALTDLGAGSPLARTLGEKVLAKGIETLQPVEKMLLMSDADVMSWLHRQVWLRSREAVAPSWGKSIRRYAN